MKVERKRSVLRDPEQARHSPGPWTLEYDGSVAIGGQVCLNRHCCAPEGRSRDEQMANARLIAAAPDLLTACRLALPILRELRETIFSSNQVDGVVHDAAEKAELDTIDAVVLLAANAVANAEGGGS